MFNNIGKKIQALAKVLCWVGIIASIILAIIAWVGAGQASRSSSSYYYNDFYIGGVRMAGSDSGTALVISGFMILILGVLFSWIGSWGLYAFGRLVENVHEIRSRINNPY